MEFSTGSVASADGTPIGYHLIGNGPGLVLVQGSMGTVDNFTDLAKDLSDTYTVYLPERRGRGISPKPFTESHTVDRDVEDLAALRQEYDIRFIFGLSSGADIALEAALELPDIEKIAVYEPALMVLGIPESLYRFKEDMAAGNIADALVVAMKASKMGPQILDIIPDPVLVALTNKLLAREARTAAASGGPRFWYDLAPTLQFDFKVIEETSAEWQSYRDIDVPVLLLGGTKSPRYLTEALNALEAVLPNAERFTFNGLGHGAAWNYDKRQNRHGNPGRVADELRRYFGSAN